MVVRYIASKQEYVLEVSRQNNLYMHLYKFGVHEQVCKYIVHVHVQSSNTQNYSSHTMHACTHTLSHPLVIQGVEAVPSCREGGHDKPLRVEPLGSHSTGDTRRGRAGT